MRAIRFALLCLAVPAAPALAAQQPTSSPPTATARFEGQLPGRAFWGGFGLGVSSVGIAIGVDLTMRDGDRVYRGRLDAVGGGTDSEGNSIFMTELAALYGLGGRVGVTGNWVSVSGGLALLSVERGQETVTTVGIPLEIQAISRRMPHLGATLAANLNPEQSYFAAILSLQVGRVP